MNTLQDLIAIAPLVLTAVGFLAVLLVETLDPERRSPVPLGLTVLTLAAALVLALRPAALEEPFGGMLAMDRFSREVRPKLAAA